MPGMTVTMTMIMTMTNNLFFRHGCPYHYEIKDIHSMSNVKNSYGESKTIQNL